MNGNPYLLGTLIFTLFCSLPASGQSSWMAQSSGTPKTLRQVFHDGTQFVAVADDGVIIRSLDGQSWTASSSGTTLSLRGVTFGNATWIGSGEQGAILTSADAVNWTAQSTPPAVAGRILSGVSFGGGSYVAVGGQGSILVSTDSVNWTLSSFSAGSFLQSVTYGGGRFVAVGPTGKIVHSGDAVSWSTASTGTSDDFLGVAYGDGLYVIVGNGGSIWTSPDAENWTDQISGTAANLRGVVYADDRFLAVGDAGTVLTSVDGVSWAAQTSGVVETFFGLAYGGGKFAAVGGKLDPLDPGLTSQIITSPTGLDHGFQWNSTSLTASETDGSVTLHLTRIGDTTTADTVNWTVSGGTAASPEDFTSTSGSVVFPQGATSASLTLTISDDDLVEPSETVEITLSPVSAARVIHGSAVAALTILDDEDTDMDGLRDSWELTYFDTLAQYDADDDPDGDNNTNAREEIDGTDPEAAASAHYTITTGVASGTGSVTLSPAGPVFNAGDSVVITAVPGDGLEFIGWSDSGLPRQPEILIGPLDSDFTIEALFDVTIANALDQPGIDWFNSGWIGQTDTSFDDEDALFADGNTIGPGDQIVVEAVIPGDCVLEFRWMVSSAVESDYFQFYLDGELADQISGETAWELKTYELPAGDHYVQWIYVRSFNSPGGSNAAWLDSVRLPIFQCWMEDYFTEAELSDPLKAGLNADPDEDDLVNLLEFAYGTNPTVNDNREIVVNSAWSFTPGFHTIKMNPPNLIAQFSRRRYAAAAGLTYTPEFSNDLSTWETNQTTPEPTVISSGGGSCEIVEIPFPPVLSNGYEARFSRIRINLSLPSTPP